VNMDMVAASTECPGDGQRVAGDRLISAESEARRVLQPADAIWRYRCGRVVANSLMARVSLILRTHFCPRFAHF
jgi:hypothetical protein